MKTKLKWQFLFLYFSEYYDDEDQKVREFYECPSPGDPEDHTRCCETESCCKLEHIDSVLGLDLKKAMIISLCVIIFCVFTGVVIIICCFAHQCPLYDACSGSWDKDQSSIGKFNDSNKLGMCQASADFSVFSNFGWHT